MTQPSLRTVVVVSFVCALALTGCRRGASNDTPTPQPPTQTPRSTPLPPVPTAVPIGADSNPVRVLLVPAASGRSQRAVTTAVEELGPALAAASSLNVEAELAESDAAAVEALCASTPDKAAVAWVSGAGYAAAAARRCGQASLLIARGSGDSAQTGGQIVVFANADAGIERVADLDGAKLCRALGHTVATAVIPSVMMRAASTEETDITPGSIDVFSDLDALADAVLAGDCDASAMSEADYEDRASAGLAVIGRSAEMPFAVFVVSPFIPAAQRAALIDAFITIGNGAQADLLRPILGHDEVVQADDSDLSRVRSFFTQANVDLATLGS